MKKLLIVLFFPLLTFSQTPDSLDLKLLQSSGINLKNKDGKNIDFENNFIENLDDYLIKNPNDIDSLYKRGMIFLVALDGLWSNQSIEYFDRIINIDPNVNVYDERGEAYYTNCVNGSKGTQNCSKALLDFEKAFELEKSLKDEKKIWFMMGRSLQLIAGKELEINSKDAEPISYFDNAIEIDPNYSEAYRYRSVSKGLIGDNVGAENDINLAISNDINNWELYKTRGNIYYAIVYSNEPDKTESLKKAIMDYDKTIKFFWENPINDKNSDFDASRISGIYALRGDSKYFLKDYYGALEDHNIALNSSKKKPEYFSFRAKTHAKLKNYRNAISDYDNAYKLEPNRQSLNEKILMLLDAAFDSEGDEMLYFANEGMRIMNLLNEAEPNNSTHYYFRGIFKWIYGDTSACRDVRISDNMGFNIPDGIVEAVCGSE
jgi:tetratricopeptide (TPR) repeat protein